MIHDPDQLEHARKLFAGAILFERGVARMPDLPDADLPEVAFAGRSNVGKSSLVNALTMRNSLARASREPGRTRQLNFFRVADDLRLVDLPGYGYAKAPKSEIAKWTALMRDYLRGRTVLKRVFVLIDARHGLKPNDEPILDALDQSAVSYQGVLTKIDKLSAAEQTQAVTDLAAALARRPAAFPEIVATSSEKSIGVDVLRAEIVHLCRS